MSTGGKLAVKTYLYYVATVLLCLLFLVWLDRWIWLQAILSFGLFAGFCLMSYNEGGWAGEHACTLGKTIANRIAEGKNVDESMLKQQFDRKHAIACFLIVSLPFCALATANLIASPNYPAVQTVLEEESSDPFAYSASDADEDKSGEPMGFLILRVVTRLAFMPLLSLYTILAGNQTLLYALFIPVSFIMPACTAIGYWRGPALREKKLLDIARGKRRKQRGLLVNRKPQEPRRPKPQV